MMRTVGLKDLRRDLGRYVATVSTDGPVTVTDTNLPKAVLVSLQRYQDGEEALSLVSEGRGQ